MKQTETNVYHYVTDERAPRMIYAGVMDLKCCRCRPDFVTHIDRVNFYCNAEQWWNSLNGEI